METVGETASFLLVEFHDEPATALEWNPHHKTPSFLRDFHRTITSSRFHRCHVETPIAIPKILGLETSTKDL
jgi:hypothetical protein